MPVNIGHWELSNEGDLKDVEVIAPPEARLEELIERNPQVLGEDLIIIGKQPLTSSGALDILGLDRDANIVVIELGKEALPGVVIAQALDCASWVTRESEEELVRHIEEYLKKRGKESIKKTFHEKFGGSYEHLVRDNPRILIVGSDFQEPGERMVDYLANRGIEISWVVVRPFTVGGRTCVSSVRIVPERKITVRPPNYLEFLVSVKERVAERIGGFEKFSRVTQRPGTWLVFSHGVFGFNVSPDERHSGVFISFSISRAKRPDSREVLRDLQRSEGMIIEGLGRTPSYDWMDVHPIKEHIPWSGRREDLTEELAEKVADRLSLYINTLMPLLPSEPSSAEEAAAE